MVERGKGTILFTGCSASLNGIAGFSELCKNFLYQEITLFKSFLYIYYSSITCLFATKIQVVESLP